MFKLNLVIIHVPDIYVYIYALIIHITVDTLRSITLLLLSATCFTEGRAMLHCLYF